MTGTVILLLALLGAGGFALHRARVDGRFRRPDDEAPETVIEVRGRPRPSLETTWGAIASVLPRENAGDRATLVQFSSAFCAPCRTTRVVLADVAEREEGVVHVEVDAEQHLDLVRALDVRRTPTTLILDGDGHEVVRAAGAPQRHQVLAALPAQAAR